MNKIEIESEVPFPVKGEGLVIYPFSRMKVGKSFHVKSKDPGKLQRSIVGCIWQWKRKHNKPDYVFETAQQDGGVRVWRRA